MIDASLHVLSPWQAFAAPVAILALVGATALAAAPQTDAIARRAKAAYEAADFEEAAHLYWQAFQADGKRAGWLYSSARAAQKAGQLDEAAERYVAFLKAPGDAQDKIDNAEKNLKDVQRDRARLLLRKAEQAPDPAIAYGLARKATELQPMDMQSWWLAAQAADRAAMAAAAECYAKVVALAPADAPERVAAEQRLRKLAPAAAAKRESTPVVVKPVPTPPAPVVEKPVPPPVAMRPEPAPPTEKVTKPGPVAKPAPSAADKRALSEQPAAVAAADPEIRKKIETSRPLRWQPIATLAGGVVVAAAGTWLLVDAFAAQDKLDQETNGYKGSGQIPMTYADAHNRAADIAASKTRATVILGVGAAAVVGGAAWAILSGTQAPAPIAVGWQDGVQVAWRGVW